MNQKLRHLLLAILVTIGLAAALFAEVKEAHCELCGGPYEYCDDCGEVTKPCTGCASPSALCQCDEVVELEPVVVYGNVVEVHLPELTTTATVPGLQGITMTITTTFDGGNLNYELTFTNPDAAAHENQSGVPEPLITERSEQFRVADQWVVAVSYTPVGGGPTTTYNYVQGSDGAEYYYSGTAQAWFVSDQNGPWRESEAPPPGDFAAN